MTTEAPAVLDASDVEAKPAPKAVDLKAIRDHAADMWTRLKEIEKLRAEIEKHDVAIGVLIEKTIPDAMREVGLKSFALSNGFSIELETFRHASVKKEDEPKFLKWLEENGFGGIIKRIITISFGKGEEAWANKFLRDLAKRKKPLPAERKDGVHSSTLKSFFKERLEEEAAGKVPENKKLPREIVSVHEATRAVLVDHAAIDAAKAARKKPKKKGEEVEM